MNSCAQTWLDERLFGWSRSAKRSHTTGSTSSRNSSGPTTPETSDLEEVGDYDDILGYVEGHGNPRARSHQNSYADLQKLRHAVTKVSGEEVVVVAEGLHYRQRKASLSAMVPVERIGALSREECFDEATEDLNQEIRRRNMNGGYEDL